MRPGGPMPASPKSQIAAESMTSTPAATAAALGMARLPAMVLAPAGIVVRSGHGPRLTASRWKVCRPKQIRQTWSGRLSSCSGAHDRAAVSSSPNVLLLDGELEVLSSLMDELLLLGVLCLSRRVKIFLSDAADKLEPRLVWLWLWPSLAGVDPCKLSRPAPGPAPPPSVHGGAVWGGRIVGGCLHGQAIILGCQHGRLEGSRLLPKVPLLVCSLPLHLSPSLTLNKRPLRSLAHAAINLSGFMGKGRCYPSLEMQSLFFILIKFGPVGGKAPPGGR